MKFLDSKFLIFFIIIFSLFFIIFVISKIECSLCKINTFSIKNDKNKSKAKIVFISDFHNKKYANNYKDLIDKMLDPNPDFIVLGGDFIDFSNYQNRSNKALYKNTIDFFNALGDRFRSIKNDADYELKDIYFVLGNHELRLKSRTDNKELVAVYNELMNCLETNDITLLDDKMYNAVDGITISGLNLYNGYYKSTVSKISDLKKLDKETIDYYFDNIDDDNFNVMVFHKPDYCEAFIDNGFDLVLSGHNHGGLINFPIIGPIFSPEFKLFPKYSLGLYEYNKKHVIVSAGIGEHFIKIRINNWPEICVVNID